jgi:hypothetical protein
MTADSLKIRCRWFENAELLPAKGNLQVFLVRCKSDRCKYIEDERDEAQQEMIIHQLANEASEVE